MKAIRLREVLARTGYSRSSILAKVAKGQFPAPIRLGENASAWIDEEVDRWLAERIAERDAGAAKRIDSPRKRKAAA